MCGVQGVFGEGLAYLVTETLVEALRLVDGEFNESGVDAATEEQLDHWSLPVASLSNVFLNRRASLGVPFQ